MGKGEIEAEGKSLRNVYFYGQKNSEGSMETKRSDPE